jgi:hypothetical protein
LSHARQPLSHLRLESWPVEKKRRGWFIKRTNSTDEWLGPYRTEMSGCLTIARHLRRELIRRDAPPPELSLSVIFSCSVPPSDTFSILGTDCIRFQSLCVSAIGYCSPR